MGIKLTPKVKSTVIIVDVRGRLVLGEGTAALREKIQDLMDRGQRRILLNLAEVVRIDSAAIAELIAANTRVTNAGGEMKLLNLPTRLRDLITITKLHMVFEIFDDEAAAIQSFATLEPTELQRKYEALFGRFTSRNLVPPSTNGMPSKH